jgi:Ca2+-transporting ATPase
VITVGLVGLAMTVGLLSLIQAGKSHFDSLEVGQSIAFASFAFMLIVAAFECRSETATVLTVRTFDSKQMNYAALGELILAIATTQMDLFNRILGTTPLTMQQFRWAFIPPIALLVLWELGKLVVRRRPAMSAAATADAAITSQPDPLTLR